MFGEPEQLPFRWHGQRPPVSRMEQNPFTHDIAENGYCFAECEACKWYKQRALVAREEHGYPPRAIMLTAGDREFLKSCNVSWAGDNR